MTATAKVNRMSVMTLWRLFSRLPGGTWLFSRLVGLAVPYTGSIGACVEMLAPGQTRISLADRRKVRNHLGSIHACALANLGEMALGLALTALQPRDGRFIPVRLSLDYLKKARGRLTCEVVLPFGDWADDAVWETEALIRDDSGEAVCRVTAAYKVGRKPKTG